MLASTCFRSVNTSFKCSLLLCIKFPLPPYSNLELQLGPFELHKLVTSPRAAQTAPTVLILHPTVLTLFTVTSIVMKSSSRLAIALRPALRAFTLRPTVTPLLRLVSQPLRTPRQRQPFSYTHVPRKGLQPDSEDPKPPATEDQGGHHALEPAHIADNEYHELADEYIDALVLTLEEMAEDAKNGVEVEYSVCLSSYCNGQLY